MSWSWLFGILWARRLTVLIAVTGCLLGGLTVCFTSPPRYLATARVTLDFLKPDPVTGQKLSSKMIEAYVASQVQMVHDYQVAIPAVEALGWLDSPDVQEAYAARSDAAREFAPWVAKQLILPMLTANLFEDSNILEIHFRAATPEEATAVVEAVRQAYVRGNVAQRRYAAMERADALAARAKQLSSTIAQLEDEKAEYQGRTGVYLGPGDVDYDTAKLDALATRTAPVVLPSGRGPSSAEVQLNQLEAKIAQLRLILGPNNVELKELIRMRDLLRTQVKAELDADAFAAAAVTQMGAERNRRLQEQTEKVLAQRDEILQLRLMQDEINRQSRELRSLNEAIVAAREEGFADHSGVTPLGAPEAFPTPVFPNPALILGGTGGIGLAFGCLLAMLAECFSRRVRVAADMELAGAGPVLGAVPLTRTPVRRQIALGVSSRFRKSAVLPTAAAA